MHDKWFLFQIAAQTLSPCSTRTCAACTQMQTTTFCWCLRKVMTNHNSGSLSWKHHPLKYPYSLRRGQFSVLLRYDFPLLINFFFIFIPWVYSPFWALAFSTFLCWSSLLCVIPSHPFITLKSCSDKKMLKRWEYCDTYLTHVSRHYLFGQYSLCYFDVYRHESGRCHTLTFFLTFFMISPFQLFLLY